jgi:hypothetical protein
MIISSISKLSRSSLTAGLIGILSVAASAATVSINQSTLPAGTTVAGTRIRASNNAWDVALSNGVSYTAANSLRSGLANSFTTPGRSYDFTLEHRAGQGFIFTVVDNATGSGVVRSWGSFTTPPPGPLVPTLGGQAATASFNALQLDSRATITGATTSFTDLVFTSVDLSSSGSFYDGTLNNTTTIGANPVGTARQSLLADVNLSAYTWTLSGTIGLTRGAGTTNADNVSFTVSVMNVPVSGPIPEPAGNALLGAALTGLAMRRRRKA